ncbi:hypothetical protein [Maridesulfovibrio salexigens]|uniref:Uncharacterized protein n=1 Tax=Maridesulfovibrio salexigens (strain ATCC 14822 / DSM 2638 / NCIMB 8403 / VKM B-1763) TaxID=526222 RepID=C6BWD7_MARSD|nr:hypothetical protein [Maridesulfovibrio salexigens]ACS78381.1 hypothetical protein Desal_0314 [Maridesulfovibrio salexigens DSM 2638]
MPQGKLKIVAANARTDAPSNVNASAIAAANRGAIDGANKASLKSVFTSLTKNMNVILSFLIKEYGVGSCFKIRCIDIHYATGVSVDTVQRILTKFAYESFLTKRKIRDGRFQGLEVNLKPVCNHYQNFILNEASVAPAAVTGFQPSIVSSINNSTYSEEALKILAVTDEEINSKYPALAGIGFGADQLQQIVKKRDKPRKSLHMVLTSLEFANYEIENGGFKDHKGKPVEKPLGYIFQALLRFGRLDKPEGFKTAEEQAADAAEERLRVLKEAKKREMDAQYEIWLLELSAEEREEILSTKKIGIPDDVFLKNYWRKHIYEQKGGSNARA